MNLWNWPTSHIPRITSILLALALPAGAEQQIMRMEATVSQSEIFLGEAAYLTLQVHGYQPELGQPDLRALPADVQLLGQQDQSHRSIQIINGVQKVTQFSGRTFTYRVQPHEAGTFRFVPITLLGPEGNPLPVNETSLQVHPIPQQEYVKLWIAAPTNHVIVDEDFEISFFVRIRKPPQPYQAYSPIPNGTNPHLHIPYLDLHPTEGLRSENLTQLLQRMVVQDGEAFRINDRVIGRDPFAGMFGRDQAARFRLPRQTDPENEAYYLYELKSRWSADREGTFAFGPVRFRGQVITDVSPQGQATQQNIYTIAEAVTVTVRTPPAAGRPATFLGATGAAFHIETSLDTQICQTGDPVTLTIDITGQGPAHRILAPRPATLAPLETEFRIQPEPTKTESITGGRRFSYMLRPRRPGTREIPPLEIAYFDLASRSYRTATSDPLPIRVNPGQELERETVTGTASGRMRIAISAAPGDLPPAPFTLAAPSPAPIIIPIVHIPLFLAGAVFLLLSLLAKWLPRHLPLLQAHLQQKQAFAKAIAALQQTPTNQPPVVILREYLTQTLGDAFAKGQTDTMQRILTEQGLDPETIHSIVHILTHDAYTGQTDESSPAQIQQLLQNIAKHIHPRKTKIKRLAQSHVLLLFGCLLAGAAIADNVSRFEQRRTHLLLLQARETTDFFLAAEALADQIDHGDRSPTVLYNLGTALLMGEQPALALPILQWAERRGATTWDVRRNMLVAQRMLTQDPTLQLPWIRKLLFWHYRLNISTRITLATTLFALLWVLGTLRWLWKRPTHGMLSTLTLLALLGASVIASLYAELQNEQNWPIQRRQIQRILALQQEDAP